MMILWFLVLDVSFLELVPAPGWSVLSVSVLEHIRNETISMSRDGKNVLFLASEPILSWIVRQRDGDNFHILRSDRCHWKKLVTCVSLVDRSQARLIRLLFKIPIQVPITIELSWFFLWNLRTKKTLYHQLCWRLHCYWDFLLIKILFTSFKNSWLVLESSLSYEFFWYSTPFLLIYLH